MQDDKDGAEAKAPSGTPEDQSRPQQGGEAATTRFGMEDGDNTDVPATGGPDEGEEAAERSS